MAEYGVKISKEGYDVGDATPDNLIFDSSKVALSVAQRGEWSVTVPAPGGAWASSGATTITTELDNPIIYAFIDLSQGFYPIVPKKYVYTGATGVADDDYIWAQGSISKGEPSIYVYRHQSHSTHPDEHTFTGMYYLLVKEML